MIKKCTPCNKSAFTVLFLFLFTICWGQNKLQGNEFWSKVRFGGGIGLGFTNGGFNGSISPSAIYQVNDQFAAGVSLGLN